MTNLQQIETEFLNSEEVRNFVPLNQIQSLSEQIGNAKKTKFEKSLKLAKIVAKANDWFKSDEGKASINESGLDWTSVEDFANRVFGWQKSYYFKMVKAGKLLEENPQIVTKFKRECTQAENNGENPSRSLEKLNKFAKSELSEGNGEVTSRPKALLTLKGTGDYAHIKFEIFADEVKTSNEVAHLTEVMNLINLKISELS